jgi:hypothetical protein
VRAAVNLAIECEQVEGDEHDRLGSPWSTVRS